MKLRLIALLLFPGLVLADSQTVAPSTAAQVVLFGPIVDATTAAAETALSLTEADIIVCQDGASCAEKNDATNLTHAGDGAYTVTLDATDTGATKNVCLWLDDPGTLTVLPRKECYAIEAAGFTALRNGTTDLLTGPHTGLLLGYPDTEVASGADQSNITLTAGPSNNGAIPAGSSVVFKGGGELCYTTVTGYTAAGVILGVVSCGSVMTVAAADEVYIYGTASAPQLQDTNSDLGVVAGNVNDIENHVDVIGTPAGATVSEDIAAIQTGVDAVPTAAENATAHLTEQRILIGTCDSGSTTTCVDDALTQAAESQLDDRLICFDDSWCALITGFTTGTDTVTTTKIAPSTRASKGYTIFPSTLQ